MELYGEDPISCDVLFIQRLELEPRYRGNGIGARAVEAIISTFGWGCSLVVCKPLPLQYCGENEAKEPEAKRLADFEKVRRFWSDCGFRTRMLLQKNMTTAPVIAILLFGVLGLLAQDDSRTFVESQIQKWEGVVARNPKDYDTLTAIGAAYGNLGQHATAVTYFNRAIAINPSFADAYAGLGSAYGFLGRSSEAISALKKAVSLDPRDPLSRLKLGTTLGKAGRYPEAITELREAVRLKPDLADGHFALGLAYVSVRDWPNAADEADALARIDSRQAAKLQTIIDRMRTN